MNYKLRFLPIALLLVACSLTLDHANAQTDVVAFWGFEDDFLFDQPAPDGANYQNFAPDAGNAVGTPNLQGYIGNAAEFDNNGGGGFTSYTSSVSGITYGPSRTIKWDDARGGGDDFGIAGQTLFDLAADGGPVESGQDFGNDALIYITLDSTGFQDLELRFDIEGTPGLDPLDPAATDLPSSFDIFYRTTGPSGTWFRDINQNNVALVFSDLDPANPDEDNQVADSNFQALNSALNNTSQVEILIGDFNDSNNELEIDNVEIVGNRVAAVPEPTSTGLILMASLGLLSLRRRS